MGHPVHWISIDSVHKQALTICVWETRHPKIGPTSPISGYIDSCFGDTGALGLFILMTIVCCSGVEAINWRRSRSPRDQIRDLTKWVLGGGGDGGEKGQERGGVVRNKYFLLIFAAGARAQKGNLDNWRRRQRVGTDTDNLRNWLWETKGFLGVGGGGD